MSNGRHTHTHTHRRGAGCDDRRLGRATKTDMGEGPDGRELAALRRAGNESVPKIIINDTINLFLKAAISIFVISNQNSFRECRLTKLPPCILFEKTKNILIHRESKKQDTKLLAITSPTIIRFSNFFH